MTANQFEKSIIAARNGQPQAFNQFFYQLYQKCSIKLLRYVSTEADAEEAFSETVFKFWKLFVVEEKELPKSNLQGYFFTMAKFYCIDQQKKRQRNPVVSDEILQISKLHPSTEREQEEQERKANYQYALKRGMEQLGERCRKIFEYMLENDTVKPREIWSGLGYNNARTFSSVKSECQKRLKIKVAVELRNGE